MVNHKCQNNPSYVVLFLKDADKTREKCRRSTFLAAESWSLGKLDIRRLSHALVHPHVTMWTLVFMIYIIFSGVF